MAIQRIIYQAQTTQRSNNIRQGPSRFAKLKPPISLFVEDGPLGRVILGHEDRLNDVMLTPDCETLVSASDDDKVRLWKVRDGQAIQMLVQHTSAVKGLGMTDDGKTLVAASRDMTVSIWTFTD